MRCDGTKPACQQCTRAKKADHCEYDDGKGKTRTQLLRETIVRLEQRIRELEDAHFGSPAVMLYNPHAHSRSGSSSSSFSSVGDPAGFSHPDSPFLTDSSTTTSPDPSWSSLHSCTPPFVPSIFFQDPQPRNQPPPELARMLLDIFSPHCRQCGLDVHMGRILETLNGPPEDQRHPVLMNAMYMWACFISRPEPLSQHEEHYLSLALDSLHDGLRAGEKVVDIIQGSCLLALYFLANGRFLEGNYHATAAAAIAVQFGFHLNGFPGRLYSLGSPQSPDTKPTKLRVREGERILAFWQVYNLDRCWSAVLRRPLIIPDSIDQRNAISCPWPQDLAEYEVGNVQDEASSETVKCFIRGDASANGYSTQALRAKASALFSRADELSNCYETCSQPLPALMPEVQLLETRITHFITALMPLDQLDSLLVEDKYILLTVHTLAHTALIRMYRPLASDDEIFYEKSLCSARACVSVIKLIGKQEYEYLDPIVGPCWSYVAETFLMELRAREVAWPVVNTDARTQIMTLLYAMTTLSSRLPIVAIAVNKLQKKISEL